MVLVLSVEILKLLKESYSAIVFFDLVDIGILVEKLVKLHVFYADLALVRYSAKEFQHRTQ